MLKTFKHISLDLELKVIFITARYLTAKELYSALQDAFDDLDMMDSEPAMIALSDTEFILINNWILEEVSRKKIVYGSIYDDNFRCKVDVTANSKGSIFLNIGDMLDQGLRVGVKSVLEQLNRMTDCDWKMLGETDKGREFNCPYRKNQSFELIFRG